MKFKKAKCQVLHLGWSNPEHRYRLSGEWIENSPGEKDWGVLVINMTWQCAPVAQKADHNLSCTKNSMTSRARRVIFLLCSALMRPYLEHCIQFWCPRTRTCRSKTREGPGR